jgi:PPM family protein phosphatase
LGERVRPRFKGEQMALRVRAAAGTHRGLRRSNNEDSAFAGHRLLFVADGMGGAAYGEIASAVATHSVMYLDQHLTRLGIEHDLWAAVKFADHRLRKAVEHAPSLAGMGTTMTAFLLHEDQIAVVHVGDSRAYVLRSGMLEQLTRDDTVVQMLADLGELDQQLVANHPNRNVLTKVLQGSAEGVDAKVLLRPAICGDRYLLCSDGLSDYVAAGDIEAALQHESNAAAAIEALVELTLRAGAPDNVTCVVADIVQESVMSPSEPQLVGAAAELGQDALDVFLASSRE